MERSDDKRWWEGMTGGCDGRERGVELKWRDERMEDER